MSPSSVNIVKAPSFVQADVLADPLSNLANLQEAGHQGNFSETVGNLGATVVGFAESGYNYVGAAIGRAVDFVGARAPSPRLPLAVTARVAAGALALSAGVAGLETSTAVAQAPVRPVSPKQLVNTVNYSFTEMFPLDTNIIFDLHSLVLRPHQLVKTGTCNPSNPDQPNTQEIDYSLAGEYTKFCTKANGNYQTLRIPHRSIVYPPDAVTMDFIPVLTAVGDDAAESAGLAAGQFGLPQRADISLQAPRKVSEADIFYSKGSAPSGVRQLRELKLRIVKGKERVAKLWYK